MELKPYTEEEKRKIEEAHREAAKEPSHGIYLIVFAVVAGVYNAITTNIWSYHLSFILALFISLVGLGLDIVVFALFWLWIADVVRRARNKHKSQV